MELEEEVQLVRTYSHRFDGAFFRLLGDALEWADESQKCAIKNTFPEWWERCLRNTKMLKDRGYPI